jgi:hypothetical protein
MTTLQDVKDGYTKVSEKISDIKEAIPTDPAITKNNDALESAARKLANLKGLLLN